MPKNEVPIVQCTYTRTVYRKFLTFKVFYEFLMDLGGPDSPLAEVWVWVALGVAGATDGPCLPFQLSSAF